ncbi:hypothetical protein NliqN6_6866 [Naganishia liquefaciens]|uniref:Uncharacterized protein n=1 Tax=Naganishia liquefaciens TaxID=104408 RepID=A0A8H3U0G1_9TREE|nr:hypothetical protein NliqN6_6866 [Naganishia liquefaciens]
MGFEYPLGQETTTLPEGMLASISFNLETTRHGHKQADDRILGSREADAACLSDAGKESCRWHSILDTTQSRLASMRRDLRAKLSQLVTYLRTAHRGSFFRRKQHQARSYITRLYEGNSYEATAVY